MSLSQNDRILRAAIGKGFPIDPGADVDAVFAQVVADALRQDFGGVPSRAKHLSRLTGMNERTVQNWLLARNGPTGVGLVVLMRHSDAVSDAVLRLSGRAPLAGVSDVARLKRDLAVVRASFDRLTGWLEPD